MLICEYAYIRPYAMAYNGMQPTDAMAYNGMQRHTNDCGIFTT